MVHDQEIFTFYMLIAFCGICYAENFQEIIHGYFNNITFNKDYLEVTFNPSGQKFVFFEKNNDVVSSRSSKDIAVVKISKGSPVNFVNRSVSINIVNFIDMDQGIKIDFQEWDKIPGWLIIKKTDLRSFGKWINEKYFFVIIYELIDDNVKSAIINKYNNKPEYTVYQDENLLIMEKN